MIILGFLLFIILLTLATDLQYTRIILKPLNKITEKLREISSPSKFDRTPVKTNTFDFATLDKALIDLMSKIDESFRKEKEITVNISHELMTPVSVMRSKLENILIQKDINEETAVRIEESLLTLQRLQRLVNSLLMIARIESRQYLLEETVEVADLLAEITDELRPVAEDKKVELKEEFNDKGSFAKANRSLLFSMFYNVINNAVKNTGQGGRITIGFQITPDVTQALRFRRRCPGGLRSGTRLGGRRTRRGGRLLAAAAGEREAEHEGWEESLHFRAAIHRSIFASSTSIGTAPSLSTSR